MKHIKYIDKNYSKIGLYLVQRRDYAVKNIIKSTFLNSNFSEPHCVIKQN